MSEVKVLECIYSDQSELRENMKEVLPQIIFLGVLVINFLSSLIDSNRNSMASLTATILLIALTYWGGFYEPLLAFLKAAP